jgi:UDP-N-acetylglucosamine 4,6-dehydratase
VDFVLDRLEQMRGGEIFVPKIPSMKLVDLAKAIGPGCKLESIGIRAGEKLHEVLIPHDEASHTLEYERHYTVFPVWNRWQKREETLDKGEEGRTVDADFHYWSKGNHWQLSIDELRALLEKSESDARAIESAA